MKKASFFDYHQGRGREEAEKLLNHLKSEHSQTRGVIINTRDCIWIFVTVKIISLKLQDLQSKM